MQKVTLDGTKIIDIDSFHNELITILNLPNYYGNNLDALDECLHEILKGNPSFNTNLKLDEDNLLLIEIIKSEKIKSALPELFEGFIDLIRDLNKEKLISSIAIILS